MNGRLLDRQVYLHTGTDSHRDWDICTQQITLTDRQIDTGRQIDRQAEMRTRTRTERQVVSANIDRHTHRNIETQREWPTGRQRCRETDTGVRTEGQRQAETGTHSGGNSKVHTRAGRRRDRHARGLTETETPKSRQLRRHRLSG